MLQFQRNLWASGLGVAGQAGAVVPLSLDGSAFKNNASGGSNTLTLSTTKAGDIIIFEYSGAGNTITGVSDTAGLTWTRRTASGNDRVCYWAYSPGILTNDVISYTVTGANFANAYAFGINGAASTVAPFDANGALPNSNTSGSSGFNTTISTTSAKTFAWVLYGSGNSTPSAGAGWTAINDHAHFTLLQYQIFSAAQSASTVAATLGTSPSWHVDAIKGA